MTMELHIAIGIFCFILFAVVFCWFEDDPDLRFLPLVSMAVLMPLGWFIVVPLLLLILFGFGVGKVIDCFKE